MRFFRRMTRLVKGSISTGISTAVFAYTTQKFKESSAQEIMFSGDEAFSVNPGITQDKNAVSVTSLKN